MVFHPSHQASSIYDTEQRSFQRFKQPHEPLLLLPLLLEELHTVKLKNRVKEVISLQEGSITSLDLLVALLGFHLHCLDEEL